MAKKKTKVVSEEKTDENAAALEPVMEEEPTKAMPEINPLPYIAPREPEEPTEGSPVLVAPVAVVEKQPPLEEQFRSLDNQRLRSIAERYGLIYCGQSREELVAYIVTAVNAPPVQVGAPQPVAAVEAVRPAAAGTAPKTHSFLLGPGEKPEMASGGVPLPAAAPEVSKLVTQRPEGTPAARKPHSSL
jgi:hypothetical protein